MSSPTMSRMFGLSAAKDGTQNASAAMRVGRSFMGREGSAARVQRFMIAGEAPDSRHFVFMSASCSAFWFAIVFIALCGLRAGAPGAGLAIARTGALPATEAHQAAAADERFVYAIDSTVIAKY